MKWLQFLQLNMLREYLSKCDFTTLMDYAKWGNVLEPYYSGRCYQPVGSCHEISNRWLGGYGWSNDSDKRTDVGRTERTKVEPGRT